MSSMGKVYQFPKGHRGGPSLMGSNHVVHANFKTGKVAAASFGKRTPFGRSVNRSVRQGTGKAYHGVRSHVGLYHVAAGLGAASAYGAAREKQHNTKGQAFKVAALDFSTQLAVHHGSRALGARSVGARLGSDFGGAFAGAAAASALAQHYEKKNRHAKKR